MKFRDLVGTALENLRRRIWRTTLNMAGVFFASLLLVTALAVTRGIDIAFQRFMNENELLRRIEFFPDYNPRVKIPTDVTTVHGQMSNERRERIKDRLEMKWRWENSSVIKLNKSILEPLRKLEHVIEVVPEVTIPSRLAMDGKDADIRLTGISWNDNEMKQRVITGQPLATDDENGLLLHEFTAYQLGWRDDSQLTQLIGQEVTISVHVSPRRLNFLAQFLSGDSAKGSFDNRVELIKALRQLVQEMDATTLTEQQKKLLRETLRTEWRNEPISKKLVAERKFVIRGIVRSADRSQPFFSNLQSVITNEYPDVYLPYQISTDWLVSDSDSNDFYSGRIVVDLFENVESVENEIKKLGLRGYSASRLIGNISEKLDKARLAAAIAASVILLIAAMTIANSMTISVLQRTREFGIMKALGSRDRHIVWMMLMEGGLTGFIGATAATLTASGAAMVLENYIRTHWIENQLPLEFDHLFQFSFWHLLLVFSVAIGVCMLAAALPARRAARLDPVEAMRR